MAAVTSKQLAVLKGTHSTTIGKNSTPAMTIEYTRIDTDEHKDGAVTYIIGKLGQESSTLLRSLNPGDKFTLVKKQDGDYWNLDSILPATAFTPKAQAGGGGKSYNNYSSGTTSATSTKPTGYNDQVGLKIGAARNQAIAFLAATKGTKFTLDDVDKVSMEIVGRQAAQEDALRGNPELGKFNSSSNATTDTLEEDPVAQLMEQDLGATMEESVW